METKCRLIQNRSKSNSKNVSSLNESIKDYKFTDCSAGMGGVTARVRLSLFRF